MKTRQLRTQRKDCASSDPIGYDIGASGDWPSLCSTPAMLVNNYMASPVTCSSPDQSVVILERLMRAQHISAVPIVDAGRLVGVVSLSDLIKLGRRQAGPRPKDSLLLLPEVPAADVMSQQVSTVDHRQTIQQAASIMLEQHIHRVFVTDGAILKGVFSTRDAMLAVGEQRCRAPISDLMSKPVLTVGSGEPISVATDRMTDNCIHGLVVLEEGLPVGVFTQREALESRDEPRDLAVENVMSCRVVSLPQDTPLMRAAQQAGAMRARRVIALDGRSASGILSGFDFLRAL